MSIAGGSSGTRSKLRLLLVEDSETDEILVLRALRNGGYDVSHVRVQTADTMRRALDSGEFEAVISDWAMPAFSGPEALRIVRERGLDVPFIIVSGTVGDEEAVAAMRGGAHDYLMKDRLARLAPTLERELREARVRRDRREAELANVRVTREKELAEAASAAKSLFLANASHELRTPLNAIIGFSELLTTDPSEPLTKRQHEYLEHILASGKHLLALINDILDLSKVEAGKLDLHLEPTSIEEVTRMALETLAPIAEKKGVALEIEVASDLPLVQADPLRLRQILFNLLSNAIKFTRAKGSVSLRARRSGDAIEIAVADTGIGIRPDDLPRLFREFQQLPASVGSASAEGTGLGLALTKRLVELHGGKISAASVHGQGATFSVQLPIERAAKERDPDVAEPARENAGARILVVEDDPLSRLLACDILRSRGHVVVEADAADVAVEILHNEAPPDLVLTDIRLPGGGGERVLREIRSKASLRAIPVIATTAHAMVGDRERFITQGFDESVAKPLDVTRFAALVEAFLSRK